MQNIFIQYRNLYQKSQEVLSNYEHLQQHDLRRRLFIILGSQILICYFNLKVNNDFYDNHTEEFRRILNYDENAIDTYIANLLQNLDENIVDTVLFQTELVFRTFYSKINNTTPSGERNLYKIIANIFDDTENNWQKEECKLIVLFWTLRNTIHTGGIYYSNVNGATHIYKRVEYNFEYGKHPKFLKDGFVINLVFELLEALNVLLSSDKLNDLGFIEHPSFSAIT